MKARIARWLHALANRLVNPMEGLRSGPVKYWYFEPQQAPPTITGIEKVTMMFDGQPVLVTPEEAMSIREQCNLWNRRVTELGYRVTNGPNIKQ